MLWSSSKKVTVFVLWLISSDTTPLESIILNMWYRDRHWDHMQWNKYLCNYWIKSSFNWWSASIGPPCLMASRLPGQGQLTTFQLRRPGYITTYVTTLHSPTHRYITMHVQWFEPDAEGKGMKGWCISVRNVPILITCISHLIWNHIIHYGMLVMSCILYTT